MIELFCELGGYFSSHASRERHITKKEPWRMITNHSTVAVRIPDLSLCGLSSESLLDAVPEPLSEQRTEWEGYVAVEIWTCTCAEQNVGII